MGNSTDEEERDVPFDLFGGAAAEGKKPHLAEAGCMHECDR
jgi:hypothetical protein